MLGAVLVDNAAFNSAAEILTRDDFYREAHRRIFEAMAALAERSQPIDLVTLKDELVRAVGARSRGRRRLSRQPRRRRPAHHERRALEPDHQGEGGPPEPDPRRQPHRAVVLRGRGRRRRSSSTGPRSRSSTSPRSGSARASSASARSSRRASAPSTSSRSRRTLVTGLPTGFVDLDEKTSGLQKGDLIIVAARPAMGKTSFCLNIAQNASLRTGETVGVFSLEMSKEQLVLRMLCADARVDAHRLRTGQAPGEGLGAPRQGLRRPRRQLADLHRRLGHAHAPRDAREVPAPEGRARPGPRSSSTTCSS